MFADLELAQRLERAEGSAGAAFIEARGGDAVWVRVGGVYAMFDGIESPLTQTFGLGMFEPVEDAALNKIEGFFRDRGAHVDQEVCPLAGLELLQRLTARGYVPLELSNVLFLELDRDRADPGLNAALTVRVARIEDRDIYVRAAAQGWSESREITSLVAEMGRVMFDANGYTGFMVEREHQVIATAGLVIRDRVALLAGGSTIPSAREQGAQRAVLSSRLRHAAHAGCDLAMMVAAPGGASQRNAERNGFRVAYTRIKWRLTV